MPTRRRPKGVIIRPLPDWQGRQMMMGDSSNTELDTGVGQVGLYNNATDGSILVVWDLATNLAPKIGAAAPVCGCTVVMAKGLTSANQQTRPLHSEGINFPGVCWTIQPVGSGLLPADYTTLQAPGTWNWPHNWPFAYIYPGWSLVTQYNQDLQLFHSSFVWEAVRNV